LPSRPPGSIRRFWAASGRRAHANAFDTVCCRAAPVGRRQSADSQRRGRRAGAGLHRGDARLETCRGRTPGCLDQRGGADDPAGLFNASLDGNTRRAIDLHEGDTINATALKALIRAAVAVNVAATAAKTAAPRKRAAPKAATGAARPPRR